MQRIDLDIRPVPWNTKVKIDGKDFPCERVVVDCDAANTQATHVELTYRPLDDSNSYDEPSIHLTGCMIDEAEYGRLAVMRDLLERLHGLARKCAHGDDEQSSPSPELAALLPDINAALGLDQ